MPSLRSLDDIAAMLETTGRFRVLKRVPAIDPDKFGLILEGYLVGVCLDCEATGINPDRAMPIEVATIKFLYEPEGRFAHVVGTFEGLQEPDAPLDPVVSALTNLTEADLAGRRIDVTSLCKFIADANIIIAHGARYDRALLEHWLGRNLPLRPWGCSLHNIDWHSEGVRDRRLCDLLNIHHPYAEGHRAMADCEALLEVLVRPLPKSGRPALAALLDNARRVSAVIFAEDAPIATREPLRARGYRWSNGDDGAPRCWWLEVDASSVRNEVDFLASHVYAGARFGATMTLVSALHRFRSLGAIAGVRIAVPDAAVEAGS